MPNPSAPTLRERPSLDLDRLEELAKRATLGPWHPNCSPDDRHTDVVYADMLNGQPDWICTVGRSELEQQNADCEYIAALDPQTVLAVVERLRRAEKERNDFAQVIAYELSTRSGDRHPQQPRIIEQAAAIYSENR